MNTKLTLKVSNKTILRAKSYARRKKTSISRLVENYLNNITRPGNDIQEITPLVKSLSGVLKKRSPAKEKNDYAGYLSKKYK
jgi:gamma-glutamyl phosphate reductase